MEYRLLGTSGFQVPELCFGTGTFGGSNEFFKTWGTSDVAEATRLVDICLEAGLTMFDSADIYSDGMAEEILGQAIKGRRNQVTISTKATFRSGSGPNDVGSSRYHLTHAVEGSLRRLGIDTIDLFQLHGFDALTPIEDLSSTGLSVPLAYTVCFFEFFGGLGLISGLLTRPAALAIICLLVGGGALALDSLFLDY